MAGVNVKTVQFAQIPNIARQMRTQGQNLHTEFKNAYASVTAMKSDWYGNRYNTLINGFNEIRTSINDILTIVVTELPKALETVANNYSNFESGNNVCTVQTTSFQAIGEINESTQSGMRFILTSVQTTQTRVNANFTKALEIMGQIERTFGTITWESESATTFKAKFTELKRKIEKSIGDIKEAFGKNMKSTFDDIQAAERANTVN